MTNFYNIKATGSETPENNSRPPALPARFQVNGWLRLDEKLWVYDVFDQIVDQPARLWLEEINLQPEAYQSRAISLQKLSHGNLLPVYNHFMWGENGKKYYVCVAKTPGKDFVNCRMLIASSPGISVVGQIARQLALALLYCHSQQVLHGNLQPSFIWIGRDGTVKLELFGALPNRRHALRNTTQGDFSNSLLNAPYASPELFGSNASFNAQADVYALGVIIYELLTGFNPFLASSEMVSGLRHMYKAVPPLHEVNPEVGPALETAIMTALYKNPEGRYHNVLELLSQFEIGLATTLQTTHQPVQFQTIDQLLENYAALNSQVQSFLRQNAPSLPARDFVEGAKGPAQNGIEPHKNGNGNGHTPNGTNGTNGKTPPSWLLQTTVVEPGRIIAPATSNSTNGTTVKTNGNGVKQVGPIITPAPSTPPIAANAPGQNGAADTLLDQNGVITGPASQNGTGNILVSANGTALNSVNQTGVVTNPLEQSVTAPNFSTLRPTPVTRRQGVKWPNLIPWLLVLNLFFMGYLAWLLLNSVDTGSSGFPTSFPTPPVRVVYTPSLVTTPTATPEPTTTVPPSPTTQAPLIITTVPPLATSTVSNTEPPTPAPVETAPPTPEPTTPAPASATDPRVLTALAPTVTSSSTSNEPVATVQLIGDDSPAPTETPTNPG